MRRASAPTAYSYSSSSEYDLFFGRENGMLLTILEWKRE
jgi:hypothetical protein